MNIVKSILEQGGSIHPLLVPSSSMIGTSLTNPSIFRNKDNQLIVNLRNINYVLYHAENGVNEHIWGPLCYLHPENDISLTTYNILCTLNEKFEIVSHNIVDTSLLDEKPLWEFVGLEDCRIVEWDNKFFLSGVRRDTTINGEGRMELSELLIKNNKSVEIKRQRIPAPGNNSSYCEKNWMPILDKPYHYVKWTNPTEVAKFDPVTGQCETVILTEYQDLNAVDLRGGSQVILFENYYIALFHETYLFKSEAGRKNVSYKHRIIAWDQDFNIVKTSEQFNFTGCEVEFCCGLCEYNDSLVITFGVQDNAAYLLEVPKNIIKKMLNI